jgi:hypothetical protein
MVMNFHVHRGDKLRGSKIRSGFITVSENFLRNTDY